MSSGRNPSGTRSWKASTEAMPTTRASALRPTALIDSSSVALAAGVATSGAYAGRRTPARATLTLTLSLSEGEGTLGSPRLAEGEGTVRIPLPSKGERARVRGREGAAD